MKRIALFAVAGLVLAACAAKDEAPKADTAAMAAPAAAAPAVDTPPMAAPMDTMKKDTTKH